MEEVDRYYQGNITLEEAESYIASGMMTAVRAFVANGYYLRRIRDEKLYKESGYKNFKEYLEDRYKKDEGWASKCIKVNQQLSVGGNSPILDSKYCDYNNKYKLVELASMTEEQRSQVSPDMSVKTLREFRKGDAENLVTSQENQAKESAQEEVFDIQEVSTVETPEPEKLSAYGKPIKVYPADSLIVMPGCEGGHDCFMCHLQCDIRQEYCRCVEATTGNPFPCEQIERIDTLREEIGERCQFIDLDQAYHRAGDHEPVPCCKECTEPCQYACERSIRKREAEEHTCNMEPDACPHREGYNCTLTLDQKNTPGDGLKCNQSCCWECRYHGMCEPECDSSAGRDGERPEFDAAWFVQRWAERNRGDLKTAMQICREQQINSERAKAIQKHMAPCGYSGMHESNYGHAFNGFVGGIDFEIGRVKMNIKYGRFVVELMDLFDPSSPEYDEEPVKEVPKAGKPDPVIDAEFEEISEPAAELKQIGDMELSCRTENILKRAGIDTAEKLVSMSDEELTVVRGMSNRALEEIKMKLNELESADKADPEESTTDLQVVRQMLEKENKLLSTCLLTVSDQNDIHIRQMKLRVAALAAFASDLDDIENPPPEPERIYTLEEVAKEIMRLEAAFIGAPVEVKQSAPYCKNVMRLDAMRLLYDSMRGE